MFCADLIVVETSNEGTCFIQTSSLDGEKNLKKRMKPKDFNAPILGKPDMTLGKTQAMVYNINMAKRGIYPSFRGKCECDLPNAELYEFTGTLKIEKKNYPLSAT